MTTPQEQEAAIAETQHLVEIRAVATEIGAQQLTAVEPFTKGIVTALSFDSSPPMITLNIGGETSTDVPDVRLLNNYTPEVGQTVLIARQGSQIIVLGHIADLSAMRPEGQGGAAGWVRADLSNGAHNGGIQGDIFYRRILDHGSWKMQWQGGWNCSGVAGSDMLSPGVLGAEFIPEFRRNIAAPRNVVHASTLQWVFDNNGGVWVDGITTQAASTTVTGDVGGASPGSTSSQQTFGSATSGGASAGTAHTHNVAIDDSPHGHSMPHDHGFSGGSHGHEVQAPTWVSLNGVEYFL